MRISDWSSDVCSSDLGLRTQYGKLVTELPVERLSEREFRDVIGQAIRVGGSAAIAALKGLTAQGVQAEPSPGAARKRAVVPPGGGDDAPKAGHPSRNGERRCRAERPAKGEGTRVGWGKREG